MDAGGVAHIVHKTVQTAAKRLAIDGQVIAGKIYTYFHTSSGRLRRSRGCHETAENALPKKPQVTQPRVRAAGLQTFDKGNMASSRICCPLPLAEGKYLLDQFYEWLSGAAASEHRSLSHHSRGPRAALSTLGGGCV